MPYQSLAQPSLFTTEAFTHPHSDPGPEDWQTQMLTALAVVDEAAWPDHFGSALRSWFANRTEAPLRTLSLFSGGGGLDIAFHDAGFQILEMVEIEAAFAATLRANTGTGKRLEGSRVCCEDIRAYEPPASLAPIDFIIGGPPCQTFSAAGRRAAGVKGTTDPRGTLFEEYVRLLGRLQPTGFLLENVYGIIGAENGEPWQEIQAAFRAAGYVIHSRILDAADYGVPQHRERLFLVGLRADVARETPYRFPCPTHGPDAALGPRPFYTARQALHGADPHETTSLLMRGRWGHLIPGIPPGLNYSYYTREMGHPAPVFAWRSKFSDFMYKADPDTPVRTVKAQAGAYTGPFSWENRHFSTAEIKRLQTFPDDYEVVGKRQVCLHQLGNSVPPQIGRLLALSIRHQVFGSALPFPLYYLDTHQPLGFRSRKRALTEQYAAKARTAALAVPLQNPSLPPALFPDEEVRFLTDTFALTKDTDNHPASLPVRLRYGADDDRLTLTIHGMAAQSREDRDNKGDTGDSAGGFAYHVWLEPALSNLPDAGWHLPLTAITLSGTGAELAVFTVLWKALEERIAARYGVDDLVQLSGYYQYTPKVRARMQIESSVDLPVEWRVLRRVVEGRGVAVQQAADTLAPLWEISASEVLPALHTLRAMGYEVRNHNTNPQIREGDYLIPYLFPTLTPRSVQRRKKL